MAEKTAPKLTKPAEAPYDTLIKRASPAVLLAVAEMEEVCEQVTLNALLRTERIANALSSIESISKTSCKPDDTLNIVLNYLMSQRVNAIELREAQPRGGRLSIGLTQCGKNAVHAIDSTKCRQASGC